MVNVAGCELVSRAINYSSCNHYTAGDWNGQVNWSDQTAPISNFDYLFNMMDDTPAMEEEVVDDMSMTDTSYKSGN